MRESFGLIGWDKGEGYSSNAERLSYPMCIGEEKIVKHILQPFSKLKHTDINRQVLTTNALN